MPAHVQMVCTKDDCGGSCNACCLAWCSVCGGGEAELTTDCIGMRMSEDHAHAVAQGEGDFTDDRGWHAPTSTERRERSPRFAP
jgi:hypothetical protein